MKQMKGNLFKKPGTLLAFHPLKWNPENKTWIGILLAHHPRTPSHIAWNQILWENGDVDELYSDYMDSEKEWKIIS